MDQQSRYSQKEQAILFPVYAELYVTDCQSDIAIQKKLKALLTENEDIISLNAMGFFENWENEIIWNNKK